MVHGPTRTPCRSTLTVRRAAAHLTSGPGFWPHAARKPLHKSTADVRTIDRAYRTTPNPMQEGGSALWTIVTPARPQMQP
jgi:hypothetical protein